MNTKKLAGIIVACTIAIILVIVIVIPPLVPTPTTPDQPPAITKLVDETLIVPVGVQTGSSVYFNVPRTGILRASIDVISGREINYYLHENPSQHGAMKIGQDILSSYFEFPLDAGNYKLIVVAYYPNQNDTVEEEIVSVQLEFES